MTTRYYEVKMKSVEKFEVYAGLILGELYKEFPKSLSLHPYDIVIHSEKGEKYNDDTLYAEQLIISETIWWLQDEKYIAFEKPSVRPLDNATALFFSARLTSKGLKALKRPVNIDRIVSGDTAGDKIAKAAKAIAEDASLTVIRQATLFALELV